MGKYSGRINLAWIIPGRDTLTASIHPSDLQNRLIAYNQAKNNSIFSVLFASGLLIFAIVSSSGNTKPVITGTVCVTAYFGRRQRQQAKMLEEEIGIIDKAAITNRMARYSTLMSPTATLVIEGNQSTQYSPENLISDPVGYIQKCQKHVALIGGTGDGKSTFTQYLASKIGGRARIYDSDCKPDEWAWLPPEDVIGRKGNFTAINAAMGEDLRTLEELVELRGEDGDAAIAGRERFLVAEEFPVLVDECDHAKFWLKRHAKRGRRYKQFILAIAQNDTAENFGLEGDKDTLYSCFVLVRLGMFAVEHAKKLKDKQLEEWLKQGGKKRFLLDDNPCELDLSNWTANTLIQIQEQPEIIEEITDTLPLNEYEDYIYSWGILNPNVILKARTLKQQSRLFDGMTPEDIRVIFAAMADNNYGETIGNGNQMGWRYKPKN